MSSVKTDDFVEIDCGITNADVVVGFAFLDSAHLLTGNGGNLRQWRTSDGCQVGAGKKTENSVTCIAASNNGQWIVAGMWKGLVIVWDGETHEKFTEMRHKNFVNAVDFAPDCTAVVTGSADRTACLWDIRTGRLLTMKHDRGVQWVKFSPDGTRFATRDDGVSMLQVFDCIDGSLVTKIKGDPRTWYSTYDVGWSSDGRRLLTNPHDKKITCFDTTTGSVVSESPTMGIPSQWQGKVSCGSISFYDESTFTQIAKININKRSFRPTSLADSSNGETCVYDISLAPDGRCIAVLLGERYTRHKTIAIYALEHVLPRSYFVATDNSQDNPPHIATDLHPQDANLTSTPPTVPTLPLLHISPGAFAPWIQDDLPRAETTLSEEITNSHSPTHFAFASRSLVHARLQQWHAAQDDAEKSLENQRSVMGLIAKSVALTGLKKYKQASRAFDLALVNGRCDENEKNLLLLIKSVLVWMAGSNDDAVARVTDAMDMARDVSPYLFVQAWMYLDLGRKFKAEGDYRRAIESLELARVPAIFEASPELQVISLIFGWRFEDLYSAIQHLFRETLLDVRSQHDVVRSFLPDCILPDELEKSAAAGQWMHIFLRHRVMVLEQLGDKAVKSNEREEAISRYMAALSLSPPINDNLVTKWAKLKFSEGSSSWESALSIATEFQVPRFEVYRAVCGALAGARRLIEASECLHKVESEVEGVRTNSWYLASEVWVWKMLWRQACGSPPTRSHDEIIRLCSAALSHCPTNRKDILVKRSKALVLIGKWDNALRDADEVVSLDPESHLGYRMRHTALLGAKRHDEALEAHKTMLSKLSASPDKEIGELHDQYINPLDVEATIREAVECAVRDLPRVLIDTTTGRLRNKSEQISAFFVTTTYKELRASMTTKIEHGRIEDAIKAFYRYVMFSHTWEGQEPTFQLVERISVYELQKTSQNEKLIEFCLIVMAAGFIWAWSDTCCIDQKDQVVLQESLVSMFRWYYCSAWTVVFLRGDGPLEASRWITRVWTNQEYVAAKKIWFYTGNSGKWIPYLSLPTTINDNHKDDLRIREAMVSSVKEAAARKPFADGLQPGLDYIREKLCIASTRNTTLPEDFAYSLLGIFGVSIPVIYGEGESSALGRLLGHLLTASGDASILAWTGESGSFHSCFPAHITVFQTLATAHLPTPPSDAEMDSAVHLLRSSVDDALATKLYEAMKLYNQLSQLPVPSFSANRMRLPCIMFPLGPLVAVRTNRGCLYRGDTVALGRVDIRTSAKLHRLGALYLVHPWLTTLLDRRFPENIRVTRHILNPPPLLEGEAIIADPDEVDWHTEAVTGDATVSGGEGTLPGGEAKGDDRVNLGGDPDSSGKGDSGGGERIHEGGRADSDVSGEAHLHGGTDLGGRLALRDPSDVETSSEDQSEVSDYQDALSICQSDSNDLEPSTVHGSSSPSSQTISSLLALDASTRALQLLARLKQPFGALLLTLTDRGYQRVAADALIKVQLREDVDLNELIENVRAIDVL